MDHHNKKLARLIERMQGMNITMEYIKGTHNKIADFLSRYPVEETENIKEPEQFVNNVMSEDQLLNSVRAAKARDTSQTTKSPQMQLAKNIKDKLIAGQIDCGFCLAKKEDIKK